MKAAGTKALTLRPEPERVLLEPSDSILPEKPLLTSRLAVPRTPCQGGYGRWKLPKPDNLSKGRYVAKQGVQELRPSIHLLGHFLFGVGLLLLFNLVNKEKKEKKFATLISNIHKLSVQLV